MKKILIEEDHFLKILGVILDPAATDAHKAAVSRFFVHDEPDFSGWRGRLLARLPGLYPAKIAYAEEQDSFEAGLGDADAVIVESLRVDAAALARTRRLKLVQKFGAITRNIDLDACASAGIPVETLRRVGNIAVAEQAFALLMALAKQICELNGVVERAALEARGYNIRPRSPFIGYSNPAGIPGLKTLFGATLGIVGLGEVGREIARYAGAFGMEIVYFQRARLSGAQEVELGARYAPLHDLLARSDYAVVQLPLNDSTRGIIGRAELAQARRGLALINVARAELIDRDALIEALDSKRLGGFALDVGYSEPAGADEPLLRFKDGNVILMPHTAVAARRNALLDMEQICVNLWTRLCKAG